MSFFVVGIVLAAGYVATHYHGWLYRGPQLIDHGMFSQPRYEAVFGDIPLNATGKYSYTFSRFPAAEAMIMLLTPDRPPLEAIQNLDTELRLRMVGQDGTVHCEGAGSLRDRLSQCVVTLCGDAWRADLARHFLRIVSQRRMPWLLRSQLHWSPPPRTQ